MTNLTILTSQLPTDIVTVPKAVIVPIEQVKKQEYKLPSHLAERLDLQDKKLDLLVNKLDKLERLIFEREAKKRIIPIR